MLRTAHVLDKTQFKNSPQKLKTVLCRKRQPMLELEIYVGDH
jgi:hypothetical protein